MCVCVCVCVCVYIYAGKGIVETAALLGTPYGIEADSWMKASEVCVCAARGSLTPLLFTLHQPPLPPLSLIYFIYIYIL